MEVCFKLKKQDSMDDVFKERPLRLSETGTQGPKDLSKGAAQTGNR